jgi:SpoVK/Ycf46/Vps4 family AAA+-type ATPase
VLSTFLNELDGVSVSSPQFQHNDKIKDLDSTVFVLAACRDLDNLDEALIRPG